MEKKNNFSNKKKHLLNSLREIDCFLCNLNKIIFVTKVSNKIKKIK